MHQNYEKVEFGEKGFFNVGIEPGSGPQPFIVVWKYKNLLGLIFPYVSITKKVYPVNNESDNVELKVGGDMWLFEETEGKLLRIKDTALLSDTEEKMVLEYSFKYTCRVFDFDIIKKQSWLSFSFGQFGNFGLPTKICDHEYVI